MKWDTRQMTGRAVSVATIWGVSKLLGSASGRRTARTIDRKVDAVRKKTAGSVRRGVRNARDNSVWTVAGVASLAIAVVLLASAARRD